MSSVSNKSNTTHSLNDTSLHFKNNKTYELESWNSGSSKFFFVQYVSGGGELMIFGNKGTVSPYFQK